MIRETRGTGTAGPRRGDGDLTSRNYARTSRPTTTYVYGADRPNGNHRVTSTTTYGARRPDPVPRIVELDSDEDEPMTDFDTAEVEANWTHILTTQMSSPTNPGIKDTWCLDSGASHNICHDKKQFIGARTRTAVDIRLGNDKVVRVREKGKIQIGDIEIEALYAPEFRISLLSTSYLDRILGLKTEFFKGVATVVRPDGGICIRGQLERGLYIYTRSQADGGEAMAVTTRAARANQPPQFEVLIPVWKPRPGVQQTNDGEHDLTSIPTTEEIRPPSKVPPPPSPPEATGIEDLIERKRSAKSTAMDCHRRLGHLNGAALRRLVGPDQIEGRKIPDSFPGCEVCILSKHQVSVSRKPTIRSTKPFEKIHADLCGPFSTHSYGGSAYFIVYICDATRYPTVYPLTTKGSEEIISRWVHYRKWIKSMGYTIKEFRSDNSTGEFANSNFKDELKNEGIDFMPAPPHTQHKNGVAERMIRSICTIARSMMIDGQVPPRFWSEAVSTACYIYRRTVRKHTISLIKTVEANNDAQIGTVAPEIKRKQVWASPHELLFGKKPFTHHLRRFGCTVYKHLPKKQRQGKLGARSKPAMFLGYVHNTTKIWRVWDFDFRRAVNVSSALFREDQNASNTLLPDEEIDEFTLRTTFPVDNDEGFEGDSEDEADPDLQEDEAVPKDGESSFSGIKGTTKKKKNIQFHFPFPHPTPMTVRERAALCASRTEISCEERAAWRASPRWREEQHMSASPQMARKRAASCAFPH